MQCGMLRVSRYLLRHLKEVSRQFRLLRAPPSFEFGQVGQTLKDQAEQVTVFGLFQSRQDKFFDGPDVFLVQTRGKSGPVISEIGEFTDKRLLIIQASIMALGGSTVFRKSIKLNDCRIWLHARG